MTPESLTGATLQALTFNFRTKRIALIRQVYPPSLSAKFIRQVI